MALTYLKVSPEEAVPHLEECVNSGYLLKESLENEYRAIVNGDEVPSEKINEWGNKLNDWTNSCLQKLAQIFISPRQQYNFRDAKTSAFHRLGINRKYDNIVSHLQARIDVLDGYINFIFQHGNITIIAGRDVYAQIGDDNKQEIKN